MLIGPRTGFGFTATTINIGFLVDNPSSYGTIFNALGLQGVADPDGNGIAHALTKYINAHGGIAGRTVKAVIHLDNGNGDWSSNYEAACADFVQDHQVFAVVTSVTTPETNVLAGCLAQKHVIFQFNNRVVWDAAYMQQWAPYVYAPSYFGGQRWAAVVDQDVASGALTRTSKIGLIWQDDGATTRTVDQVVKPRLAQHGLNVVSEYSYPPPNSTGELGNVTADMSNAVLKFHSAGVDRVLFIGTSGEGPLFFAPAAQSQGYHPRYGFTSMEIPQIIAANVPAQDLHGAFGVGWWPTLDVAGPQDPGDIPNQKACISAVKSYGVSLPDRFSESQALKPCDGLLFLQTALERASSLTPLGMRAAVDRLGKAFHPAYTFSSQFGPDQLDGATGMRRLAFVDACSCFHYVGATQYVD